MAKMIILMVLGVVSLIISVFSFMEKAFYSITHTYSHPKKNVKKWIKNHITANQPLRFYFLDWSLYCWRFIYGCISNGYIMLLAQ